MDLDQIERFIKSSAWFKNMPDEVIARLAKMVILHELEKEDVLIQKGDESDSLFILRTGWVKVVIPKNEAEPEVILNHLGPGEFVGEMSLIDQKPRSASIIALSDVIAIELKRDDFLQILDEFPVLGLQVIINISSRMRFMLTYVDKAIHWSYKIAEGDYSFMQDEENQSSQSMIIDNTRTDDMRANRFLAAFFKMVEGVQEREELLFTTVQKLSIQIDESKRDKELENLMDTKFFQKLQNESNQLRKVKTERGQD